MSKIILIIAILSIVSLTFAGTMYIHMNDGTTVDINIDDIDMITFETPSFYEGWESGIINPVKWKTFGSPLPILIEGGGHNSVYGFDANGDGAHSSGALTYQNFDLSQRPVISFWVKGHSSQPLVQSVDIGWSETTADNYSGTGSQPGEICKIYIAPETQNEVIIYSIVDEFFQEDWNHDWDDEYMQYKIKINNDNTVSFYRSESPQNLDLILIWRSTVTLDVTNYPEQAFVIKGRSDQIVDDIEIYIEN